MRPRRPLLALTSVVLALAAWVSRGAIGVTDAAAWPRRLGILPSRWAPAVLLLVVTLALVRARRATLQTLLVPVLLLLPWLPVPIPAAALIWSGHVITWVWMAAAVSLAVVAWPDRWNASRAARLVRDPRRGSLAALALAFVLYCAGAWCISDMIPGGDEPHYLVITQSLLKDGDLQIENNHAQGDYRAYFGGELRPDFLRRGKNEQIYSIHAPGLPALVLPAFAVAGYRGVIGFMALLSALGTWLVWRAGYRLTGSAGAAWFGWATVAVSVPFFFHAFTVYPDAVGALIVMTAMTTLVACDADGTKTDARLGPAPVAWGAGRWLLQGAALALLPWLHTRYAGAAVILGLCLGLRLLSHRAFAKIAALFALPLASAAAWFGYFYVIYGEFNPAVAYGYYTQSQASNIPLALPALLFDQQFGVLPNAPVYALGLVGLASLFRVRRRLAAEMTVLLVSYVLLVAAFHMWWGGWSAPARFTVPVLLMLGMPAAVFWSRQRAAGKAIALSALVVSVLITATMTLVDSGALIFNDCDGYARWLDWITPVVDAPHALPSFLRDTPGVALVQAGIWILCLGGGAAVIRAIGRRTEAGAARVSLAVAAPLVFGVAIMVASTATWKANGVAGPTPSTASLALLRSYDPNARPVGLQFKPFGRLPVDRLPARLALGTSERRVPAPDGPQLMLEDVPAGVYRLAPATVLAAQGRIDVTIGRARTPIDRWSFDPAERGGDYFVRLPIGVNSISLSGDDQARRTMPRIALEPVSIVAEVWRFTLPRAARAARYDDVVAFSFDMEADLEGPGIWVHAGLPVPLAFAGAADAAVIRLLLRNCPVENRVTLRGNASTEVLSLKAGEERIVELPVDKNNGGAFVVVTAEHGYRPADVDKSSRDLRNLGVWIQAPRR